MGAGGPGWRGELSDWLERAQSVFLGTTRHAYLSCACLHGLHEQCGQLQQERGDAGSPHCKFCAEVCRCLVCRHEGAVAPTAGMGAVRAYHSVFGRPERRGGQVRRLHIIREDGRAPGKQTLCGQHATGTTKAGAVLIDPMPATPPDGLTWCPTCIGLLTERTGRLDALAALLTATAVA